MGNATGKLNGAMACDGGGVVPTGIYPESAQDYDEKTVQRLIFARQLAPFYEGADDADPGGDEVSEGADSTPPGSQGRGDDGWWSYNLMLAQRQQEQQQQSPKQHSRQQSEASLGSAELGRRTGHVRKGSGLLQRLRGAQHHGEAHSPTATENTPRHERSLSDMSQAAGCGTMTADACRRFLRRHIECPICFLYYPQNINYTRCCHKPICTECFVQIKRKLEEDRIEPTHCPYCVAPNLGVVYIAPPTTTTTVLAEGSRHPTTPKSLADSGRARSQSSASTAKTAGRPTLLGADPVVVMSDDIRPARVRELTAQLDARRKKQMRSAENMVLVAAATRMASARNARRSGTTGLSSRFSSRPRRGSAASRVHQPSHEYAEYVGAMRAAGHTDLEEFMFQEAVRQSLAEQEHQQSLPSAGPSAAAAEAPSLAMPPDPGIHDQLSDSAYALSGRDHTRRSSQLHGNPGLLRGYPEDDDDNILSAPESVHTQSNLASLPAAVESATTVERLDTASEGPRPMEAPSVSEIGSEIESEYSAFGTSGMGYFQTVSAGEDVSTAGNNRSLLSVAADLEETEAVAREAPRQQSRTTESVAQSAAAGSSDVLTLAPFELDAIASVSSSRHRRPAPPIPVRRDDSRGHRYTFSSPMPGDLMSFVDTPPVLSTNNPFLATISQQLHPSPPILPPRSTAAASGASEPRRRRPVPPPPPQMQHTPGPSTRLRSVSHGATTPGSAPPAASGSSNSGTAATNASSQPSTTLFI